MSSPHKCIICDEVKSIHPIGKCAHSFCKQCTTSWLSFKNTCPLCRMIVGPEKVKNPRKKRSYITNGHLYSQEEDLYALSRLMGI